MINGANIGAVLGAYQQVHSGGGGGAEATATWEFADTLAASVSGLSAADITEPGGLILSYATVNGNRALSVGNIADSTSAAAAVNGNYFETTITGEGLTITNIAFRGARGGSSTPRGMAMRSSDDSYATEEFSDSFATAQPTYTQYSHDVSIPVGSGVTLRFYPFSPDIGATLRVDDLVITAVG